MEQNIEYEESAFCKSINLWRNSIFVKLPYLNEETAKQFEIGLKKRINLQHLVIQVIIIK